MGLYLNPGNDNFRRAVHSKIYVDKSGMIAYTNSVLDTEQAYICMSRPRRFGKSITAAMLTAYYGRGCDSHELFRDLDISRTANYEKYMNAYNSIYLDIADERCGCKSAVEVVPRIQEKVIEELRQEYENVLSDDENSLVEALAQINQKTGVEFVVIIDEWDALFRDDADDVEAEKEYINLLRGLFKSAKSKKFVKLAFLTGIFPIVRYSSESALNNFDEFTMLMSGELAEYVGFTEDEVRKLCDEYDMDYQELADWYDGYTLGTVTHIYNPNSVVKAISYGLCDNYWTRTVSYESLRDYISYNFDGLKDTIVRLLAGEPCKVDTRQFDNLVRSIKSRDGILTVLVHLGYLAYDIKTKQVSIPNNEIREQFVTAVDAAKWTDVMKALQLSDQLLHATWEENGELVAEIINQVHMENTSIFSYNNENSLACVIELAYYSAMNEYIKIRELPTGKGFADIVYVPKRNIDKPALVIELKQDQSAEGAIRQIKERKYITAIEKYTGKILLVGINYDPKSKKHSCVIEEWDSNSYK